jgi:hypothetical protein
MSDAEILTLDRTNAPWSERYAKLAPEWNDADKAASLLETTRTSVRDKMVLQMRDEKGVSWEEAKIRVNASDEWSAFNKVMVEARSRALLLKARIEYIRMRQWEEQSENASKRVEMRMTGSGP